MKLSRKILSIFIISSIITVAIYVVSVDIVSHFMYGGEVDRVVGKSSRAITVVRSELGKTQSKGREYEVLMETVKKYEEDLQINDGFDKLHIREKFENDNIAFKAIIDSNLNPIYYYVDKNMDKTYLDEMTDISDLIKEKVSSNEEFTGIISGKTVPYMVYLNNIRNLNGELSSQYILVVQPLTKEKVSEFGKNINRNASLVDTIEEDGEVENKDYGKENYTVVVRSTSVTSYYKIGKVAGDKDYYIRLDEPSVVRESTNRNIRILSLLSILILIIVNYLLLTMIKKLVVKRIEKINKEINEITKSKNFNKGIEEDGRTDEIANLIKDINSMFSALENTNNLILYKEKKYSKLINSLNNGYGYFRIIYNTGGNPADAYIEEVNDSLAEIFGKSKNELIGNTIKNVFQDRFIGDDEIDEMLSSIGNEGQNFIRHSIEVTENLWVDLSLYTIEDGYFAMILTNITDTKLYAEEMRYLANYDMLTDLPNRYSLYNYLGDLRDTKQAFNIFFIDLDNFKILNDTLGHNTGDDVLCKAANRLKQISNENIRVGRLGGDEFLVIEKTQYNKEEVIETGNLILNSLSSTFKYKNYTYELKASVGVSSFPKDSTDIETLLKYADIAMYKGKSTEENKLRIFSEDMLEEVMIESDLKSAIENKNLIVYYQPIYNMAKEKVLGAEALIRWYRNGNLVKPCKFIDIAKRTGDIREIDNFVLEDACKFCKEKRENGYPDFQVSINASHKFLKQMNFIEMLQGTLDKYDLDPSGLKLEITEDEVIEDMNKILKVLEKVKDMGIKIALDDFGVGYSSFGYMKTLPIDTIKIDKSLLYKIENDEKSLEIVKTLLKLAHIFELDVIAEGVEISEQLDLLKKLDCDKVQGYIIGMPTDKEGFNIIHNNIK